MRSLPDWPGTPGGSSTKVAAYLRGGPRAGCRIGAMDDQADDDVTPLHTPSGISGESLLAVTGVSRVLETKPTRVTRLEKEAAERLPRDIRRACNAFLDEDSERKKIPKQPAFDYAEVLDHITTAVAEAADAGDAGAPTDDPTADLGLSTQRHEALAAMFRGGDSELGMDYIQVAEKAVLYLQGILPIREEQTNVLLKPVNIDPSDTEIARFRRAWDIANDPMVILRDMEHGILVPDQVTHVAAMFPNTYAAMKDTLATQMGAALARKKSWRLSWAKNRQVEVLYQTSVFSPGLAADLQSNFAKKPDAGQKGPPPVSNPSKAAAKVQTSVGEISDGSAS